MAYTKLGIANSLARACGLHEIRSNRWDPSAFERRDPLDGRRRFYHLPPPIDSIDLGDRIWAFWDLVFIGQCSDFALDWQEYWKEDEIKTPFPWPVGMYEMERLGMGDNREDETLNDLFDPEGRTPVRLTVDDLGVTRIKAVCLLRKAHSLCWLKPENPGLPPEAFGSQHSPRVRTPIATFRLESAIARFEESLRYVKRDLRGIGVTSMQAEEAFLVSRSAVRVPTSCSSLP